MLRLSQLRKRLAPAVSVRCAARARARVLLMHES